MPGRARQIVLPVFLYRLLTSKLSLLHQKVRGFAVTVALVMLVTALHSFAVSTCLSQDTQPTLNVRSFRRCHLLRVHHSNRRHHLEAQASDVQLAVAVKAEASEATIIRLKLLRVGSVARHHHLLQHVLKANGRAHRHLRHWRVHLGLLIHG